MAKTQIKSFDFEEGQIILNKYEILERIGKGWEGEVYRVRELGTNVIRAAKFFLPQRNVGNKTAIKYARKLHKLRNFPIVIQYITQDIIEFENRKITILVTDFIEGETLAGYLARQEGKRLDILNAVILLHRLVVGVLDMHGIKEYHGDLHSQNIIVKPYGLGYDVKVLDMFFWGKPRGQDFKDDLVDLIKVFLECLGGKQSYSSQPQIVKDICCGMRKNAILNKFKNLSALKVYLENLRWE